MTPTATWCADVAGDVYLYFCEKLPLLPISADQPLFKNSTRVRPISFIFLLLVSRLPILTMCKSWHIFYSFPSLNPEVPGPTACWSPGPAVAMETPCRPGLLLFGATLLTRQNLKNCDSLS